MAYKTPYELHHHFPKLAEESGFSFNTHRSRVHIDWSKIRLIDIENLMRERKFIVIEQHLNDILDCTLESEFDVRILDEGVIKMFRLAQLAVEYQQFCRHYLDRSVYVLREEITSLAQELATVKKEYREKDEELRKLKKRMRQTFKTPNPYGNDNIASMILKTLTNKNDPSSIGGALHYNKCTYCDKVFLNQLYLQSHMTRRHNNILTESPQKDKQENEQIENLKLSSEVMELKTKLEEMEIMIVSKNKQSDPPVEGPKSDTNKYECDHNIVKETKDAEVSTNNEDYLLNKIEEWKKEEHEKYSTEINMLRNQIMDTINSFKVNELQKPVQSDTKSVDQLKTTIIQQGAEIIALKKELDISKIKIDNENAERSKHAEAQILLWTERAEKQSKQYELLLQKLNEVTKLGQESRAIADIEKERAAQLQYLLQQSKISKATSDDRKITNNHVEITKQKSIDIEPKSHIKQKAMNIKNKSVHLADRKHLEQLHRKAQELLNIGSTDSSSSDSASIEKAKSSIKEVQNPRIHKVNHKSTHIREINPKSNHVEDLNIEYPQKTSNTKEKKMKNVKSKLDAKTTVEENTHILIPGSPMKVVRAKLVEEVNSRLAAAGVDPLKNGIPQSIFQKQKRQLQLQHELKSKKNPAHENVRHSILTYLDSNTTIAQKEIAEIRDYISPSKLNKPFRSLTSVIANVKSKAMSFVKLNEVNTKDKRRSLNSKVTKRAMSLLQTPTGSATSSPVIQRHSPVKRYLTSGHNSTEMKVNNKNESKMIDDKNKNSNFVDNKVKDEDSISENISAESDHKYYNDVSIIQQSSKSIESLIKSPVQRPTSANLDNNRTVNKYMIDTGDYNITRSQSETYITELKPKLSRLSNNSQPIDNENSSDAVESLTGVRFKKATKDENTDNNITQTKSVLKNASSTSINKKKVLFDMDAIQMKSVSASPSQSTEKSDGKENYELGIVNLDGEEWDVSSIENEPLKNDTKIQINTRTSPKIAELKQTIESQLARRKLTPSTGLFGGVDVLAGPRAASVGGSNTSLGSSILDDSESIPAVNHTAFVKPKKLTQKDDSDLDISEFSIDGIGNNKNKIY